MSLTGHGGVLLDTSNVDARYKEKLLAKLQSGSLDKLRVPRRPPVSLRVHGAADWGRGRVVPATRPWVRSP